MNGDRPATLITKPNNYSSKTVSLKLSNKPKSGLSQKLDTAGGPNYLLRPYKNANNNCNNPKATNTQPINNKTFDSERCPILSVDAPTLKGPQVNPTERILEAIGQSQPLEAFTKLPMTSVVDPTIIIIDIISPNRD
jgi:hypothetical protein